ncbi:50S ribosomal protein L23 [Candidatus Peregrinibacteria bacterium CG10_big_fil_rev_8_21_14_0_10_49_16]|nr:MAG: 50S ribosomal protein L23 [Candidatus Peregrinibacteria bacterium CG22_combo_CG10-13_8_21_14_all_49_11]PIR51825.1 MAG: 50S ribosomal protein L23 [Candidatus Peregrinibacteria bacterium CG10_big_fil_rev_8_21_14_0_10_49_16]
MRTSHIILGPLFTEKTERLKGGKTFTIHVVQSADKISIQKEIERLYDVQVRDVRVIRVPGKSRLTAKGSIEKRKLSKKAMVTLKPESKPLDLAAFRSSSS